MITLTRAQRVAVHKVWLRVVSEREPTYRTFRRTVTRPPCDNCVMVPFAGMWLGIEPDGYTHS